MPKRAQPNPVKGQLASRCPLALRLSPLYNFAIIGAGRAVMRTFIMATWLALAALSGMLFVIGRQIKGDKAIAYLDRGVAYADKGEYDRAIADFDQALRLVPNLQAAANNRRIALELLAKRPASR